jgi:ribosomal protein S12 methylthiotransferase
MGVFSYSDEDAARSYQLGDKVDAETIAERRDTLMQIQKKISRRKLKPMIGKRVKALLEGPSKDTDLIWEARLEGMAPEIDGKVYITEFAGVSDAAELPPPGSLATVEITESQEYDLVGRAIEFEQPLATQPLPAISIRSDLVSIGPLGS